MKRLLAWFFQSASTRGSQSPAITYQGSGNVTVTYGHDQKAAERDHRETMAGIIAIQQDLAHEKGVPPEVLEPIFAHLGQAGLSASEIRDRADDAVRNIVALANRPAAPSNDGVDIAAVIGATRERLRRLQTADAIAGLEAKIAEEKVARRQRLLPLLREKAEIERATYDHAAATATLREIVALGSNLAWAWGTIGDIAATTGELDAALAAYQEALAATLRQLDANPQDNAARRNLSTSHDKIGDVRRVQGDLDGALAAYRDSLAIHEALASRDPGNTEWQRDLSVSHNKIGDVRRAQGDLDGALAAYRDSLALAEALARRDPGNTQWQRDLSVNYERIGDVLERQSDVEGALASYERSLPIAERLAALDKTNVEWREDVAITRRRIAALRQPLAR